MGRTGSSPAGRLLVAAADRADSAAERLLVRLLREAGIDGWVLGHPLGPYTLDLALPHPATGHRGGQLGMARRSGPLSQRPPQGQLHHRRGWDLLRFTWHGLHEQPTESVTEIRQTLAAAA
ncbi:hypothetical protein [Pseudonocardia adelaidensis]|uniref:Uncharacterized protein n=1 Tax=Pseudonocardia adelaidensis TaxID=648754 RepID=A0ABP9NHX5_9PSEU